MGQRPGQVLGLSVSQRDPGSVADPTRGPALPTATSSTAAATATATEGWLLGTGHGTGTPEALKFLLGFYF